MSQAVTPNETTLIEPSQRTAVNTGSSRNKEAETKDAWSENIFTCKHYDDPTVPQKLKDH